MARTRLQDLAHRLPQPIQRIGYAAHTLLDPVRSLEVFPVVRGARIRPGDRVLDLGFGSGVWAHRAARRGGHVTGIEVDRRKVGSAARRYPEVTFLEGLAEATNLPSASFDVVLLISVLEHTDDPDAVLAEVERLLKPGGRLALTTDAFDDPRWRSAREVHAARWAVKRFFDRREIEELLQAHGLRVMWTRTLFGFPGARALLALRMRGSQLHWLLAPFAWLASLAAGESERGAIISLVAIKPPEQDRVDGRAN